MKQSKQKKQRWGSTRAEPEKGRLERLEKWLARNRKKLFVTLSLFTLLFSLLHFNLRISEGGDDSSYIFAGFKYAQQGLDYFYTYNAPLYPMFLALPIKFFGLNIFLLKFISVPLYFFSFIFFFRAFEGRVPYLVLVPPLLFYAFDAYLQFFASQTYNEAFFLFFQSLFLFYFLKLLDRLGEKHDLSGIRENWRTWIIIGVLAAVISLVKNLGVAVYPVIILFFLLQRQWKYAAAGAVSAVGARLLYELIKNMLWGARSQFATQTEMFLRKDPYIPANGNEDLSGFISRFFGNCVQYLSRRLGQIFGFQADSSDTTSGFIAFLVIVLLIVSFFIVRRRGNRALVFAWMYTGGLVFVSFIVLHLMWDQPRLIVIHVPVLLLLVCAALHHLFTSWRSWPTAYFAVVLLLCGSLFISSLRKAGSNFPVLVKNMKGDIYEGYTPDWKHFLQMSRWCADSLEKDAVVASRKAGMSFIYGRGKEFFAINQVVHWQKETHMSDPDSALLFFKENKIRYLILANLRFYPNHKGGGIINTMQAILEPVVKKYPNNVRFVHAEGAPDDEPCMLYEVRY